MRRRTAYLHKFIPPGSSGDVAIEHVKYGAKTFTLLSIGGVRTMSDSLVEWFTNRDFLKAARGDVLIAGLGVGYVVLPLRFKQEVDSVTVIEKSQDVIDLVEPGVRWYNVSVELGDIFSWEPPAEAMWDTIYFDMFAQPLTAEQEDELSSKFAPHLREGGWMGAWHSLPVKGRHG